jgi:transitional endoplasmic reticulum ATPase
VDSKDSEIILVLTTNEVENIHQGMLRPGRLDAVIAVERPDAEAVTRLMRLYGRGLIDETEDLTRIGMELAGSTPAVVREVVERAKLTALSLSDQPLKLTGEALLISAQTMKGHLMLLNKKTPKEPHAMEILGTAISKCLVDGMQKAIKKAPAIVDLYEEELALPTATGSARY